MLLLSSGSSAWLPSEPSARRPQFPWAHSCRKPVLSFRPPCFNTFLYFAGLSVLVALDADRLTRTFAGPRVSRSSLPANGKPTDMSNSPITADGLQALQI